MDTKDAGRFLVFVARGRRAAISADAAAEVLPLPRLSRPAQAPGLLAGFLNLGGAAIPVLDVGRVLTGEASVPGTEDIYRHLVRLTSGVALLVDRVEAADATAEGKAAVEPERSVNGVIAANLRLGGELVPRLDVGRLLLAEEAARLAELAAAEQARLADLDSGAA